MNLIFNLQVRDWPHGLAICSDEIPIAHGTKYQKVSVSCFICQHQKGEEPEEPNIISPARDLLT